MPMLEPWAVAVGKSLPYAVCNFAHPTRFVAGGWILPFYLLTFNTVATRLVAGLV
jgi:hypothetical protein